MLTAKHLWRFPTVAQHIAAGLPAAVGGSTFSRCLPAAGSAAPAGLGAIPRARQHAQRLLWQGGVLGDKGEFALTTLDDELRERQIEWPGLWSLLAVTGFLAKFPPDRYLLTEK